MGRGNPWCLRSRLWSALFIAPVLSLTAFVVFFDKCQRWLSEPSGLGCGSAAGGASVVLAGDQATYQLAGVAV